ncbi:DUF397 domain-containing protein [Kitasatospora sp. NBC_01266]|uniref:DUF397 domain-containing protein n=1 Tax=Kitasatospora sp. NBC_01266 TaxID=2903572 RepID=UPI002E324815|nr:DUF397 domain-containing protein [Kitasatospora sp. NBC_01266]
MLLQLLITLAGSIGSGAGRLSAQQTVLGASSSINSPKCAWDNPDRAGWEQAARPRDARHGLLAAGQRGLAMADSTWRKSSHSQEHDSYCVEVGDLSHGIGVRDSKDRQGPHLSFPSKAWSAFLELVRNDSLHG